jgi:hypothetical protein
VTWVLVDRELNFANPEIRIAGMVAAMTDLSLGSQPRSQPGV